MSEEPIERQLREVLSVEDVAALLQIEVATVRALARRGELPGVKLGKHWRFLRDELLESLRPAARSVEPADPGRRATPTMSQEEAARLLGVSVRTIHRMATRGQLEKIPSPTGVLRLSRASVQAYRDGPRPGESTTHER